MISCDIKIKHNFKNINAIIQKLPQTAKIITEDILKNIQGYAVKLEKSHKEDGIIVEMIERWILMTRTFIEVPLFTKRWKEIGLDDNDLHSLQIMLLKDPESGPVMEGTGGIRKVRFPLENKGKSGSVRVCYTDFAEYEMLYLITAFEKKEQENLSTEEKNVLRKLVKSLKNEAAKNRS